MFRQLDQDMCYKFQEYRIYWNVQTIGSGYMLQVSGIHNVLECSDNWIRIYIFQEYRIYWNVQTVGSGYIL
jgi:hypothetical protein